MKRDRKYRRDIGDDMQQKAAGWTQTRAVVVRTQQKNKQANTSSQPIIQVWNKQTHLQENDANS